ncbi:ATP-dependent translocase ABCB1 isoform X26 [Brienomyrus brachyistius]|uniref:ATP-dependent translocase ABCB1 isoform X21 n=1 Tax=Brienomyrus brachyistius TaxID=42636 RepID=UPI0020B2DF57|nr:ATP-dependent translocase ABCB1 isoform X21 [Brienomyrus brachyistius]XP_048881338.1 ATP-dependent translocase ABCB1 isoform X24 [Brienomyrus brachyistius]XP_048881341.1 ATP-dependent translocase ABCB1 isoform X26 [Brienomyrus brachyistius]
MDAVYENSYTNDAFVEDEKRREAEKKDPPPPEEQTPVANRRGLFRRKRKEPKEPVKLVGFFQLFRYAKPLDIILMIVGLLCAAANGVALPLMCVVFGQMTDSFVQSSRPLNLSALGNVTPSYASSDNCPTIPGVDIETMMANRAYYFVGIGVAVLILGTSQVTLFLLAATRQTKRIRERYFHSVIHQQMGWFDTHQIGVLITRLTDDINTINDGLGDKICLFVQLFCTFIAGLIIGFVNGWKLTLVILAVSPLLAGSAAVWSTIIATLTSKELSAYAKAGAVAEEILVAIRTVVAFNGQKKAVEKYESNLVEARNFGVKKAITTNVSMGLTQFIIFGTYALAFWYGTKLSVDEPENYSIGRVLTVFFAVMIGAFSLGQGTPNLESVAKARGAAYEIYKTIDLPRPIDSSSKEGHKPETVKGDIEFKNINFSYPSRKDVKILQGVNLVVPRGKTIALVGASGCGKSTTIQLLQRFYDPDAGEITLDGHDIRTLNVKWLRENIGIVSQEPVLFATTIAENIRYGWENATDEDIERAVKEANAYEFISKLPDKMNTMVGERGAQLSGGQKQRIAIARALVKNPKILLLDEATSALDTQSESIVQAALDKARTGRTTIIIAHRLSTIKTADIIAGFRDGVVTEQGTHSQLMALKGVYYSLVMQQNSGKTEDRSESSEDDSCDEDVEEESFEEDPVYAEILHNDVEEQSTSQNVSLRRTGSLRRRSSKKKKKFLKKPADKENKEEEEKLPEIPFKRVLALNKPEWPYLLIGVLASLVGGAVYPCVAIVFAKIIGVFAETDPEVKRQKTLMFSLLFLLIGGVAFVTYFLQGYMFGKSGELLTMRLRSQCFRAMMGQEIGWFDDSRNAVGVLTTKLATDASLVKGAAGSRLGLATNTLCALIIAIVVAFIFSWQLTLLILACVPFLSGANFIQMRATGGHASKDQQALELSGKISTETVENFRTVVSLSREEVFFQKFKDSLSYAYKSALHKAPIYGLTYALAQAIPYFVNAAIFRFGAWLIAHCYTQYENVFLVFSVIVFAAMNIGQSSSFAPDFAKAKASAQRILTLLERKPEIDIYSEKGDMPGTCTGNIEFHDVHFMYPTRRNVNVLQGLNVSVSSGQTLALVGGSGCGKSTSIQLLERFYNVASGHVSLDGHDIKSLNLAWLRSQLGLVSQEPILFDCSIAENIQYGDNSRDVSQTEIEEAAKSANIHTFIQSLPETYNTRVGDKGAQLSGGQKQRIAIARALVRHPKVLLLDEATSALDTESEKIVQQALDKARLGRTCVVIAHRLSTIQNADIIAVIQNGRVVEQGTHSQLMQREGAYYALVNAQVSH